MSESLRALIHDVRFRPVRLREGYDMGEVDYFLDRLEAAVAKGEPIDAILDQARFNEVRLREGYDIEDVDKFLADLRTWQERDADPEGFLDREPEPESIHLPPIVPEAPSVITERRGFFARLFGRR